MSLFEMARQVIIEGNIMAAHIPFANTPKDCQILKRHYGDSHVVRVSLEAIDNVWSQLPQDMPVWLDPAIDGCEHHLKNSVKDVPAYIAQFEHHSILTSSKHIKEATQQQVQIFVDAVMAKCLQFKPKWITVPQLPMVTDTSRNRINSLLAKATCQWKIKNRFNGLLILPLIFTNQQQLKNRTSWRPRLDSAIKWYQSSAADGVWVVDSSLSDQMSTKTFRDRLPSLLEMHDYLRTSIPSAKIIAGPYWGMNLIIWAKGLCDYPAVCLGTTYQYYLPGDPFKRKGKSRIAIPPLKRWVVVSPEFRDWVDATLNSLDSKDEAFRTLNNIRSDLHNVLKELQDNYGLMDEETNRRQIAIFYKKWLDTIEKTPGIGRPLALYQHFSSAFALGKQLPTLPPSSGYTRRPERVAEYFMLNCL